MNLQPQQRAKLKRSLIEAGIPTLGLNDDALMKEAAKINRDSVQAVRTEIDKNTDTPTTNTNPAPKKQKGKRAMARSATKESTEERMNALLELLAPQKDVMTRDEVIELIQEYVPLVMIELLKKGAK